MRQRTVFGYDRILSFDEIDMLHLCGIPPKSGLRHIFRTDDNDRFVEFVRRIQRPGLHFYCPHPNVKIEYWRLE